MTTHAATFSGGEYIIIYMPKLITVHSTSYNLSFIIYYTLYRYSDICSACILWAPQLPSI